MCNVYVYVTWSLANSSTMHIYRLRGILERDRNRELDHNLDIVQRNSDGLFWLVLEQIFPHSSYPRSSRNEKKRVNFSSSHWHLNTKFFEVFVIQCIFSSVMSFRFPDWLTFSCHKVAHCCQWNISNSLKKIPFFKNIF